jgi:hypothetical protein
MAYAWRAKDPAEKKPYRVDWSLRIPGDPIQESTFNVPEGLTKGLTLSTDATTTVWLSGGEDGTTYEIVNTITCASGRIEVEAINLKIKSKSG